MKKIWKKKNNTYICNPKHNGAVAQMVEQWTENPCVGSSILPSTTKKKPTQKGRFLALYSVMMSCRKAPPEFRFASSTLRNFVPSGAAHEAAAGHALSEPSDNENSLVHGLLEFMEAKSDFLMKFGSPSTNLVKFI